MAEKTSDRSAELDTGNAVAPLAAQPGGEPSGTHLDTAGRGLQLGDLVKGHVQDFRREVMGNVTELLPNNEVRVAHLRQMPRWFSGPEHVKSPSDLRVGEVYHYRVENSKAAANRLTTVLPFDGGASE